MEARREVHESRAVPMTLGAVSFRLWNPVKDRPAPPSPTEKSSAGNQCERWS
jgi:hypothetical protein